MTATLPLNVLLLGGCRPRQSAQKVLRNQTRANFEPCGPLNGATTVGEILQTIAFLRGEARIPVKLRPLCRMPRGMRSRPDGLADLDVALLEVSTPFEIIFRNVHLHHFGFRTHFLVPMKRLGTDISKLVDTWFFKGVKGNDEAIRAETAAELVRLVPDDFERPEFFRAIIRETRCRTSDIAAGLEQICRSVKCPVGIVLYVFRYMPDGRAIDWPAGFLEQVKATAGGLGLPMYDPTPRILEFGVERAFRQDQEFHYVSELLPIMGEELIGFAESVYREGRRRQSSEMAEALPA